MHKSGLSIDEVSLSKRELYTYVTNKKGNLSREPWLLL